jgi:hypothetical protein
MMRKPNHSSRPGIGEAALALGALVLAFAACEFAARHLSLGDKMGWSMVPRVDARVASAEKAPRQGLRALVLGDSQTEWRDSTGQSYVRVAERQLIADKVQAGFVNLAQTATGIDQYFANLTKYTDRLAPDVVVVGVYLGNDIRGAMPPLSTPEGRKQALLAAEPAVDQRAWWKRLALSSVLVNFVHRLAKRSLPQLRSGYFEDIVGRMQRSTGKDDGFVQDRLEKADAALVDASRADTINPWLLAAAVFYPDYYASLAAAAPGTEAEANLAGALADLAVIAEFCRERKIPVVAVLIPPPVWVSARYHDFFRRLGHGPLGPPSGKVPLIQRLHEGLEKMNVHRIDVLDDLRRASEDTYLPQDDHLNRRGHEIVGAALARWLVSWRQASVSPR